MFGTVMKPTIATSSGNYFDFIEADPKSILISDIAKGLSNTCRFGGQCKRFYSVAEHSVLMSYIVDPEFAFIALMHDAAEAYTGDIPKPLKQLLPDFAVIEERVEKAVSIRFGTPDKLPPEIKSADRQMLCAEQIQVMGNSDDWGGTHSTSPASVNIQFWSPIEAEMKFIRRYSDLT